MGEKLRAPVQALQSIRLMSIASHLQVYACDMIGFGLSTRPEVDFSGPEEAETFLVHYLAAWLTSLGLDAKPFILAGHSLGAYVVTGMQF